MAMLNLVAGSAANLPAPPYPADVKSAGWGFLIEPQRLMASDTWALAPVDLRPWLTHLWLVSWTRTPCATYPDDDEVIAAAIGMPQTMFAAHRKVLMRGWIRHNDTLLYHRVLTSLVIEMMGKRRRDRERKELINNNSDGIRRSRRDSTAGTGTGTGTGVSQNRLVRALRSPGLKPPLVQRKRTNGSRLPDQWFPPDDWLAWAMRYRSWDAERAGREALVFRDYWYAKAGANAIKVDWFATWRNWIRRASP